MVLQFGLDAHGVTSMSLRVVDASSVISQSPPPPPQFPPPTGDTDIDGKSDNHVGCLYMPVQESTTHESEVRAYVIFGNIPNHVSLPSFINELEPFWPTIRRLRCLQSLPPKNHSSPPSNVSPPLSTARTGYAVLAELSVMGSQIDDDDDENNINDDQAMKTNSFSTASALSAMRTMLSDIADEYDNRAHDTLGGGGGGLTSASSSSGPDVAALKVFIVSSETIHLRNSVGGADSSISNASDDEDATVATLQDVLGDGEDERTVSPPVDGGGSSPLSQPSSASLRGGGTVPTLLPPSALPPRLISTTSKHSLGNRTTTATTTNSAVVVEGSCSICLERLFTFPCVTTLCCHTFHIHCYSRTLPQCPLCRYDLSSSSGGGVGVNPSDRIAIKDRVLREATAAGAVSMLHSTPATRPQPTIVGDSAIEGSSGVVDGGSLVVDDTERIAAFRRLFQGVVSLDRLGSGMAPGTPTHHHPPPQLPQQQPMRCSECCDQDHQALTTTTTTSDDNDAHHHTTTTATPTNTTLLWMCLMCGHIGCGRAACGHSRTHYEATGHRFAIDVYGPRVWDYRREMYVHRVVQQAVLTHNNNNNTHDDSGSTHNSDVGVSQPPPRPHRQDGDEGVVHTATTTDPTVTNSTVTPPSPSPSPPPPPTTATPTSTKEASSYPPGGDPTRSGGGGGGLWVDYGFHDHEDRARLLSSVELVSDFYSKLLNHQLRAQQCHYEALLVDAGMQGDMGSLIQNEVASRMVIVKESKRDVMEIANGFKDAIQACRRQYVARIKKLEQEGGGGSSKSSSSYTAGISQKATKKGGGGMSSSSKSESAGLETDRIALEAAKANLVSLEGMKASLLKKEAAHIATRDALQAQLDTLQADTMKLMEHF